MKYLEKYFKIGNEIKVIKIEEETIEEQTWFKHSYRKPKKESKMS